MNAMLRTLLRRVLPVLGIGWSSLVLNAAPIVAAEYYIGEDPGVGLGTPVPLTDGTSLATGFQQAAVSLTGKAPGTYTIGLRVKDNQGRWSNPALRRFTLSAGNFQLAGGLDRNGSATQGMDGSGPAAIGALAGSIDAEYFIGEDPGVGRGTALTLADKASLATGFQQAAVSLTGRAPGNYTIGLRVKDNQGRWSNPALRRFTLSAGDFQLAGGLDRNGSATQGMDGSGPSAIGALAGDAAAEYFVGRDPGAGKGTPLALQGGASLATGVTSATIPLADLPRGTFNVGLRVRDREGRWSHAQLRRFTIKDSTLIAQTVAALALGDNQPGNEPRPQVWSVSPRKYAAEALYQVTIGGIPLEIQRRPEETLRSFMMRLQQAIAGDASLARLVRAEMIGTTTLRIARLEDGASPEGWVSVSDGLISKVTQVGDLGSAGRKIVAAEYFTDIDPGEGKGTPVTLTGGSPGHQATFPSAQVDISRLRSGGHRVGLRFKNAAGRWGAPVFRGYGSFLLFGDPDTTPPVITLQGSATPTLPFGGTFTEPGFSATDAIDGPLTDRVVVTGSVNPRIPGLHPLTYSVVDSAGNLRTVQRRVMVLDATAPTFAGSDQLSFTAPPASADAYRGLTASDPELGSLSHRIRLVSGAVDWGRAGSYPLVFEVADTAGNSTRFTRTVTLSQNATLFPDFESWIAGRAQGLAVSASDLAPDADADQDGQNNRTEWLADNDPFDAFSRLEMDFTAAATGFVLQWSCNQRINYRIDSSADLLNWQPYSRTVNADEGNHFRLDVPFTPGQPRLYHRLDASPRSPIAGSLGG